MPIYYIDTEEVPEKVEASSLEEAIKQVMYYISIYPEIDADYSSNTQ